MTRFRRPDGSDLVVCPAAAKELADLLADLDSFGAPAAPAVDDLDAWLAEVQAPAPAVESEDQEVVDQPVEDDLDAWIASLGASQVAAPAVMEPEEDAQENQASQVAPAAPEEEAAPPTKTANLKSSKHELADRVLDILKNNPDGVSSYTLRQALDASSIVQRVKDLRDRGWPIQTIRGEGTGDYVTYRLTGPCRGPKPQPIAGLKLVFGADHSIKAKPQDDVSDPKLAQELAAHLALEAAAWLANRTQVQP